MSALSSTAISPPPDLTPCTNPALRKYADAVVLALEMLGVKAAFGVPGGAIATIFKALCDSSVIQTSLSQHEGGGAYMAMGRTLFAASASEMGLCFATSGPGITNLITGVCSAFEERIPIFVLTGNVSTDFIGKVAAQDSYPSGIDAVNMLRPVTVRSVTVYKEEEVLPTLIDLYREAVRTRRPVHLNLPINVASRPIPPDQVSAIEAMLSRCTEEEADPRIGFLEGSPEMQAIRALLHSPRPVFFCGNGVKTSKAQQLLLETAEALAIPVIATSHAKGCFPEDHSLYFGTFGFASTDRSRLCMEQYQPTAIVYLGSRMGETSTLGWSPLLSQPELKIHVDWDASQLNKNYPVTFALDTDLRDFLRSLTSLAHEEECLRLTRERKSSLATFERVDSDAPWKLQGPIHPRDLVLALNKHLPNNAVLFSDIGNSMAWCLHHLVVRSGQEFVVPIGLGAMGSALCMSVGAKTNLPSRPVVCLTGDCAALMHAGEIFSSGNLGAPVKFLVLNDGGHGMVEHGHKLLGIPNVNARFQRGVDFRMLANAFGLQSYEAASLEDFLTLPLAEIFTSDENVLIDVKIDGNAIPPILARARVLGMMERSGS